MKTYTTGNSPAIEITYPLGIPLGMFRGAEEAAKHAGQTFGEYIQACIHADLECFFEQRRLEKQRRKDNKTLKRLSKSKKITIITQEDQP
ncbi:MAG: hypothetical protein WCK57_00735 [Verrucomicrobiae bacterium]